jgi:hypothetical protein
MGQPLRSAGGLRSAGAEQQIAFALFAVALGIAAGCLLRRTVPALATTVLAYVAARLVVAIYLRPHYLKAVTRSFTPGVGPPVPPGSWTLSSNLVDPAGHAVNGPLQIPNSCLAAASRTSVQNCLGRLGYHTIVRYQPPSHYWPFQWLEAGLFAVAAVALLGFAVVHTLRSDA